MGLLSLAAMPFKRVGGCWILTLRRGRCLSIVLLLLVATNVHDEAIVEDRRRAHQKFGLETRRPPLSIDLRVLWLDQEPFLNESIIDP